MTGSLEIEELCMSYGENGILHGIDLEIQAGEICAVIGQSGSGKTTMIRGLLQLERPISGRIRYGREVVDYNDKADDRRNRQSIARWMGYVPQSSLLFPHLTAEQNVMLPLTEAHQIAPVDARARAHTFLSMLRIGELADRKPWELSGGQQQRVAIARALAIQPLMYLLDEPTSALDLNTSVVVGDLLQAEARKRGAAILVATHNLGFARKFCDSIALLADGRIAWHQKADDVDVEKVLMELL